MFFNDLVDSGRSLPAIAETHCWVFKTAFQSFIGLLFRVKFAFTVGYEYIIFIPLLALYSGANRVEAFFFIIE